MTEVHEGPFWDRVAGKLPPPPGSALLGWQPIVGLEKGLGRTIKYFRGQRRAV